MLGEVQAAKKNGGKRRTGEKGSPQLDGGRLSRKVTLRNWRLSWNVTLIRQRGGDIPSVAYAKIQIGERQQMACAGSWRSSVWLQHGVGHVAREVNWGQFAPSLVSQGVVLTLSWRQWSVTEKFPSLFFHTHTHTKGLKSFHEQSEGITN